MNVIDALKLELMPSENRFALFSIMPWNVGAPFGTKYGPVCDEGGPVAGSSGQSAIRPGVRHFGATLSSYQAGRDRRVSKMSYFP
jgi:hypothetical protein